MSEYQYYEFRAIDRALTKDKMAALRRISTRAEITSHGFVNSYEWGDLKADPMDLVEKYFDAFVYVANWGTHRFAVRLPRSDLDVRALNRFLIPPVVEIHERGDIVILEFTANDEAGVVEEWEGDEEWMPDLIGLREMIADGDFRVPYVAWLGAADIGEMEDDETEPPVPPGLGSLSPALGAFARFMRVGDELLDVARERSKPAAGRELSTAALEGWVRGLPAGEKDDLLIGAMDSGEPGLGATLRRRFQREAGTRPGGVTDGDRTVGELIAAARAKIAARERAEAEKRAKAEAKRLAAEAAERAVYLDGLARRGDEVWSEIDGMVDSKKPTEYDRAVRLVGDVRDVADRDGDIHRFVRRIEELRARHAKKVSFLGRLDEAGLEG